MDLHIGEKFISLNKVVLSVNGPWSWKIYARKSWTNTNEGIMKPHMNVESFFNKKTARISVGVQATNRFAFSLRDYRWGKDRPV